MAGQRWGLGVLLALALAACTSSAPGPAPSGVRSPETTATFVATSTTAAGVTPARLAPTPSPTAEPLPPDILARHLLIPSLGIDAEVQLSEVVAVSGGDDAGGGDHGGGGGAGSNCVSPPGTGPSPQPQPTPLATASPVARASPSPPEEARTFTVPAEGIATPKDAFDYLRHRSWIFGHSRWLGVPGLFFALQGIRLGDELFIDGVDRATGHPIDGARFVVTGIYLSDTSAGGDLVAGDRIGAPGTPLVILQTSVRESGANRPWILDRETLLEKAETVVQGTLDDPCKYLLLFVVAEYAP